MKQPYDDDDGRVIADMSGVEKRSALDTWFGLDGQRRQKTSAPPSSSSPAPHGRNNIDLSGEERRAALFGVLKASLLIGLVYLGAFALLILLLLALWHQI